MQPIVRRASIVFILGVIASCGTVPLQSDGGSSDGSGASLISIVVSPGTATIKRSIGTPLQLTATATYSDATELDVSSRVTWSSGDMSIAAVSPAGVVSTIASTAAGDVTISAMLDGVSGSAQFNVVDPTLVVSSFGTSRIDFFPAFAQGDVAPIRSIRGAATTLAGPRALAIVGNELFVATTNAIVVFPISGNGNIVPTRRITGPATLLDNVIGVSVSDTEIFVGTRAIQTTPGRVVVFPVSANGDVMPTREISGALTTLTSVEGIRFINNELYITNGSGKEVIVFPANATGNVAPARRLAGNLTAFYSTQDVLIVDGELFVSDNGGFVNVFPATAAGNIAPTRTFYTDAGARAFFQAAILGSEIVVTESTNDNVLAYPLNASGTTAPVRTLGGTMTGIDNCLGVAVY
jgi:hypothetical protein